MASHSRTLNLNIFILDEIHIPHKIQESPFILLHDHAYKIDIK